MSRLARWALDVLFDTMDIPVDPAYEVDRPPSPRHVFRGWLSALSEKSENDLRLVLQFIDSADIDLQIKFPSQSELKWFSKLLRENSRKKPDAGLDPTQVKKILHNIEPID